MIGRAINAFLHRFRRAASGQDDEPADGLLLERFLAARDEAAFETLLRRHGPMVLGVCQRLLDDPADAEDTFQATFLVLVRKAGSIDQRQSLAGWLYGVAYRTALKARQRRATRLRHERQAPTMSRADPLSEVVWCDLRPVLDDEVSRLPEKYRTPLLLCDLEGKTYDEAARQLGCSRGALSTRLTRARDLLRARLTRRGVTLSVGALSAALTQNAAASVPAALAAGTVRAAAGVIAGSAALSPDGRLYACADEGGRVRVREAATGKDLRRVGEKDEFAVTLTFSADGKTLAVGTLAVLNRPVEAQSVRLWDVATGKRLASIAGAAPGPLALSADGRLLAVGDQNAVDGEGRSVAVYEVATGKPLRLLGERHLMVGAVAFSPDGKLLATAGDVNGAERTFELVRLWDVASGKKVRQFLKLRDENGGVEALVFSPDGRTLATGDSEGAVRLWEVASGKERQRVETGQGPVRSLAFSADGRQLLSGGEDSTVLVWDVARLP